MKTIKRIAEVENHGDVEGSWAISYGDMITLLLAFFILFFSVNPHEESAKALAQSLLATLKPLSFEQSPVRDLQNLGVEPYELQLDEKTAKTLSADIKRLGNRIVVEFPNLSFFRSGEITVTKDGMAALKRFANLYTPYAGKHMVNIVGFADATPVTSRPGRIFRDNLELSVMRAVAAQRALRDGGIPLSGTRLAGYGVDKNQKQSESKVINKDPTAYSRRIILIIEPKGDS